MNSVVITGCGLITPLGNSIGEFERRMFAGDSGIRDIRGTLVADNFPVPFAGIIDDTGLPSAEALGLPSGRNSRGLRYAVLATRQAVHDFPEGLPLDGIIYGTPGGVFFELVVDTYRDIDTDRIQWNRSRAEYLLEVMAKDLAERGHGEIAPERLISINSACASGIHCIGMAFQFLKAGLWQRCIVGGIDAGAWESSLMNFHLLNALTTADVPAGEASRPFSPDRSGFVKSEAAATLLMETRKSAEQRGARILAEVCGFGLTSDAYRLTDGREDNLSVIRAMEQAIETAGIQKEDIDYISAHGTSTQLNDRLETMAIKKVFGDHAYKIPVSSLKSQTGHPTVASGAMETVACILMFQRQRLAPTINFRAGDPECDLDYVPHKSRPAEVKYILNNAFGFGGQNACIVLRKAD
ncbi:MAG: beta-ketoacyl-[acyl-carrier-protein] synthase family protein [Nitrospirae bacterium]|nr:MAG: beta-ketoacyl-[acyl-carrier-protein] synthase family protein [Nitrospirota bacterium]